MTFYLYILRCADGSYYVGHTENLERRLAEHQVGGYSRYTAGQALDPQEERSAHSQ